MLWIGIGPQAASGETALQRMGELGLARQIAFILGSVWAAGEADRGRPLIKHLRLEVLQLAASVALGAVLLLAPGSAPAPWVFVLWTSIRFALSGASFVLGFRVMSAAFERAGAGTILHLVTQQGATLFAPLVALALPLLSSRPFMGSVAFDALTTFFYCWVLAAARGTALDLQLPEAPAPLGSLGRLRLSITEMFRPRVARWGVVQIVALVGISGFAVTSFKTSQDQKALPVALAYPLCSAIYGAWLWLLAPLIKRSRRPRFYLAAGGAVLVLVGVLEQSGFVAEAFVYGKYAAYCGAFWMILHASNRLLIEAAAPESIGALRASMVFYLCVIFGLSEWALGWIQAAGGLHWVASLVRIVPGALVLGLTALAIPPADPCPRPSGSTASP